MYGSIIAEHAAVRRAAGLFDVSHMGQCEARGPDAEKFLDFALTNSFAGLPSGRARYSLICDANGECIDDLIVYKISDSRFLIVLNAANTASDIAQLRRAAAESGLDVEIADISDAHSMLAVQGPESARVLKEALWTDISALEKFAFLNLRDMFVSRTGYTGSDGFEIICKNADAERLADHCAEAGATPCGLGARDSLRLEAGYPLYGHELSRQINPYEAGLGWAVKLEKDFVGRNFLKAAKDAGLKRRVAHFKADGRRIVREGEILFSGDSQAGRVLSGAWSPALEAPIMSAIVDAEFLDAPLHAEVRGTKIRLERAARFI